MASFPLKNAHFCSPFIQHQFENVWIKSLEYSMPEFHTHG